MKAFDIKELAATVMGEHRDARARMVNYPYVTDHAGNNLLISIGDLRAGRQSPVHRHNFDQIRFMLKGTSNYGDWVLAEGECGYFPESVAYGPQIQESDALILTLQFPGDSNAYYPKPEELRRVVAELRQEDARFGKGGVGRDISGKTRDAFELAWERLRGETIAYAPPRYSRPIAMRPASFAWRQDASGRATKFLGTFGDSRTALSIRRLNAGEALGPIEPPGHELWFLLSGDVSHEGKQYQPHSGFIFEPGDDPVRHEGRDAQFLVVAFPTRDR